MNTGFDRLFAFNAYEEAEDSDNEGADSTDDDVDAMLQGTMEQVRRIRRRRGCRESSSEDEFEKEMKNELEETMKNLEHNPSAATVSVSDDSLAVSNGQQLTSFYDNSYFDSDSDEDETSEEKKKIKRPIPSNDELFYDPEMDDHDQKWIDQRRRVYQPKATSVVANQQPGQTRPGKARPLPSSDAVLNCPGCMSLLCLDCQRHATYSHQYRAMFVMNCTPDMTEVLHHTMLPKKKKKSNKRKRPQVEDQGDGASSATDPTTPGAEVEVYHPVKCDLCKTEVAVYDNDEVFHFFNILASY